MDSTINLQRWQQAFEDHPISTTRAIEKQLRSSVANNRERLRGLVGGNYRELLSTADKIVYLDGKTKAVEVRITEIGRRCGPPDSPTRKSVSVETRSTAELWLLQSCLTATGRALTAKDILRASQLIVISRLLLKSLQNLVNPPSSIQILRNRVSSLRQKSLHHIDSALANPRSRSHILVNAACAYCLITSASATEAFQYTQRLRLEKLKAIASREISSFDQAHEVLRYILSTLQILRRAFGRPIADGLNNLQRRPVLQDLDLVRSDVVASDEILWLISSDIRSFSPYFKRQAISAADTTSSLSSWAVEACQAFTTVLQDQAARLDTVAEVLNLRRKMLTLILPTYFDSTAGDILRQSITTSVSIKVTELGREHTKRLAKIAEEMVNHDQQPTTGHSIWNKSLATMSLNDGSEHFLKQIHKRYHGEGTFLLQASQALSSWINSMKEAIDSIQSIKAIRWQDILEEPGDDQEDVAAQLLASLSESEPQSLLTLMHSFLKQSLEGLTTGLATAIGSPTGNATNAHRIVYYIRVVRLVITPVRQGFPQEPTISTLEEVIARLHKDLASNIATEILKKYPPATVEKAPPVLDDLPSPTAFNLLQGVCDTMQKIGGTDIWSRAATRQLKQALKHELFPAGEETSWTNFDRVFLTCALDIAGTASSNSVEHQQAESYWQRTRLLFAILVE